MVRTVEELIEQARLKEEAIQTDKEGMKKESIDKFKSYFIKPKRVSVSKRVVDRKISKKLRKAVNIAAPKGSMVKKLTAAPGKKVKGRGRGRPRQTYKTRVLPSGKMVKVPTHIYKKMLSQEKAAIRLAAAQRQAQQMEAEQIAMAQDPRFQPRDQFLDAPDMQHEQNVAQAEQQVAMEEQYRQQMQQMQPQRSITQRAGDVVKRFSSGVNRLGQPRFPQEVRGYPQQYPQEFQQQGIRGEPRVTAISRGSNILNQPNIFNKPENVAVGFKRRV